MAKTASEALTAFSTHSSKFDRINDDTIRIAFSKSFPSRSAKNFGCDYLFGYLDGASQASKIISEYLEKIEEYSPIIPSLYNFNVDRKRE